MARAAWGLLMLVSLASANAQSTGDTPPGAKSGPLVLAVIVHPKNPVTGVTFGELRSFLKLERQFWPNRKRCVIYLPSSRSASMRVLLKKVYRMSHKKLQKYWIRKLFAGEIPAKPSHVPSAKAAGSRVVRSLGAMSVVPADKVPPGVRVLAIDGKRPGDKGYSLFDNR